MKLAERIDDTEHYYAFVESIEPLSIEKDPPRPFAPEERPPGWRSVLESRIGEDLPKPTHAIWLDCVSARYLDVLDWRYERCRPGNREESATRRKQLLALDGNQFVAALVLVSNDHLDESTPLQAFGTADWHVIQLGKETGIPASIGIDFEEALELPDTTIRRVHWHETCSGDLLITLRNVFNLNFLPDADFGERDRSPGEPTPRNKPSASRDSGQQLTRQQRLFFNKPRGAS